MDCIRIQSLELECIIGVRPDERHRPQRVSIDVDLGAELAAPGRSGRLSDTCDYDVVAQQISELVRFRHYELMETAAEELCAMLFAVQPTVERLALRIAKPDALGARARGAAVHVDRLRQAYPPQRHAAQGSVLRIWLETHQAKLLTLSVPAEKPFVPPREWLTGTRVESWLLRGRVQQRGRWLEPGGELVRLGRLGTELESDRGAELFLCLTTGAVDEP
jgi:FolB domain-containing protein